MWGMPDVTHEDRPAAVIREAMSGVTGAGCTLLCVCTTTFLGPLLWLPTLRGNDL